MKKCNFLIGKIKKYIKETKVNIYLMINNILLNTKQFFIIVNNLNILFMIFVTKCKFYPQ